VRADYFQKVISKTRGLDVAADIIEQTFQKYQTEAPRDALLLHEEKRKTAEDMVGRITPGKRPCGQRRHQVAAHLQRSSIDEFKLTHCRV
jgi:hypothetical protein